MKQAASSLKIFGIYLVIIPGLGLLSIPEFILDLLQLSHGDDLWVARMVGLLAFVLGVYYIYIGKYAITVLYMKTVIMRYLAALFMVGLWITDQVEIMILLFAAIDAAGASWTMIGIKRKLSGS
ncbi:MAG: hypothetical protein Sapg2KO_22280 [Saprospiraceae bacterium]